MKSAKINKRMLSLIAVFLLITNMFSQDSNFHIYLCFGQSNMEGSAAIEEQDKTVNSRFQMMPAMDCTDMGRTMNNWYKAVPPLSSCWHGLSPADYFGRTMVANLPDSIRVGVINVAVGGCDIRLFDKDIYKDYTNTYPSDWFREKIMAYGGSPYERLIRLAKRAQRDGVIKGILIHQGETNTGDNQWPLYVKTVYDNMLTDLSLNADDVPLLAGELVHADQNGKCASMNGIINTLPESIPTAHVISSKGCAVSQDSVHFNSAGVRELGKRYALKMLYLKRYKAVDGINFQSGKIKRSQEFIKVKNGEFIRNGKPYRFIGTNLWYGMNLGAYDKERLIRELDRLNELGVKNLRLMAASEGNDAAEWRLQPCLQTSPGVYNERLLEGMDFLLVEMKKRDMVGVMCLNNFWPWSGGMSQYMSWANNNEAIPFPPPAKNGTWRKYQEYSARFYSNKKAVAAFNKLIEVIVNRKNKISGIAYKNDPTIMAWQLANEPQGVDQSEAYRKWIHKTAKYIKSLDKNHLVSIGSEGNTPFKETGNDFEKDHLSKYIDYCTFHLWIQNWGWYDPQNPDVSYKKAIEKAENYINEHFRVATKVLNKPVVLEEFGISRDFNDYKVNAPTKYRDAYYASIFEKIVNLSKEGNMAGANFWAWAGEGRPREPKTIWKTGDDLIGDPPHEYQGWYSVYDSDESTKEVIKKYCVLISE